MRRICSPLTVIILFVLFPMAVLAQSTETDPSGSVPRLINVIGVFRPANGQPPYAVETITVSIYADQQGGTPLWQETQAVTLDERGRYSLVLGASHTGGIPPEIFGSGAAHWLGTRFERPDELEGPRVRLTSVPYALRALDADTLGGRPASDYLLTPSSGTGTERAGGSQDSRVAAPAAELPGTPNSLAKYVDASNVGPSAVYESGGMVGVGTSAPFDNLHVRYTNTGGNMTGFAVQNLGNTSTSYSGMLFYDQNGALGQFQGFNNVTHEYRINNIARNGATVFDGSINFMIGSTSRFLVSSNGNIGIGTTSPQSAVEVVRDGEANVVASSYGGHSSTVKTRVARGTPAAPAALQNGDILGAFGLAGYATTGFSDLTAGFGAIAAENWSDTANGAALGFLTTPLGATDPQLYMAILPGGNVGIGTPADSNGIPTASDKLQVFGDIRIGSSGTNGCLKNFAGTGIAGTCASDRRFKKDITPFGPVLAQLTALQPVHYFWRAADFPERQFGNERAYGLIAQDVEQVLPDLVVTNDDGIKAVDYSKLPLLTIQAIKDLKADNDALKAETGLLKQRVTEVERLLKEMLSAIKR